MLTFGRCYSEDFHPDDKLLMIESDRFYEGQLGNEVVSATIPENLKIKKLNYNRLTQLFNIDRANTLVNKIILQT